VAAEPDCPSMPKYPAVVAMNAVSRRKTSTFLFRTEKKERRGGPPQSGAYHLSQGRWGEVTKENLGCSITNGAEMLSLFGEIRGVGIILEGGGEVKLVIRMACSHL